MLKRNFSILAIILAIVCTLCLFLLQKGNTLIDAPYPMNWSISLPEDDTSFGGIFLNPVIDDSLRHYEYKRKEDSVMRIQEAIKLNNQSTGAGRGIGAISVLELPKERIIGWNQDLEKDVVYKALKDSLQMLNYKIVGLSKGDSLSNLEKLLGEVMWRLNVRSNELLKQQSEQQEMLYYFGLNGYALKDYDTKFFTDKGTFNLAYVVWDSVKKRTFDSTKYGHYERKEIAVRYAVEDKKVLIPITKQQYRYTELAMEWGGYVQMFLAAYFFLGLPIQIVLSISKGKAFTTQNIKRIKWMAIVLAIFTLLSIFSPYLLRWYYSDIIPEEFVLQPLSQTFFNNIYQLIIALGLFILSKAFKRGYKLQQENALTI